MEINFDRKTQVAVHGHKVDQVVEVNFDHNAYARLFVYVYVSTRICSNVHLHVYVCVPSM